MVPESESANVASEFAASQQQTQQQQSPAGKQSAGSAFAEPGKPPSRSGACRVCLKSFKPDDYSKTCFECQQRVCEDCASYSKLDENEDAVSEFRFRLKYRRVKDTPFRKFGAAAFAAEKWPPESASPRIPPTPCSTFP